MGEYVSCGSLAVLLAKFGQFMVSSSRSYIRDVLRGLAYLHSHGIVHRDVKPANVLVEKDGSCKLADFGTANLLHAAPGEEPSTLVGDTTMTGSPLYMAPECIKSGVCLASDIWSLGVSLIELLTGDPGWKSVRNGADGTPLHPVALVRRIADTDVKPLIPSELPAEVTMFISHCLKRNPSERASATQLLHEEEWLM
eukprot:NODE_3938_length_713_cov_146.257530_g3326_i0.p1 GENE.NODE_3938_length_713_cov_146.257530_g3326_i0~~NODE_3938_length_713_cov_146.257530_g3326_i0.p1  ORF type:complete len:207 (+),score=55.47 NODE_3938_length_713_cov_146.257530_g3326_i0:32-622(+)